MEGNISPYSEAYFMSIFGALPEGFNKMEAEEKTPEPHYYPWAVYARSFGTLPRWFRMPEDLILLPPMPKHYMKPRTLKERILARVYDDDMKAMGMSPALKKQNL